MAWRHARASGCVPHPLGPFVLSSATPYASISIPRTLPVSGAGRTPSSGGGRSQILFLARAAGGFGLAGRNADERTRVKAHAMRRGLDLSHLQEPKAAGTAVVLTPDVKWLRDAGAAIAATWFLIRGCNASIPICWSPCRRELSEFRLRPRLIVRTAGKFKWAGGLIRRGTEAHYFPTTPTRWFFSSSSTATSPCIYLIPSRVLAGRVQILLRTYSQFIVGNIDGVMKCPIPASWQQDVPTPPLSIGFSTAARTCRAVPRRYLGALGA